MVVLHQRLGPSDLASVARVPRDVAERIGIVVGHEERVGEQVGVLLSESVVFG